MLIMLFSYRTNIERSVSATLTNQARYFM